MHSVAPQESESCVSEEVLSFAVDSAFQGLKKSERKSLHGKEPPVPCHADLRPKKVDRFIKKYFKRKGLSFNPSMDRRQLNLAARILDAFGPLTQLWEISKAADDQNMGLDPAMVIDLAKQAIALTGNASFCALTDRRKSLPAKISPEFLALLDEASLFNACVADRFGKKFKKAMLKELKHDKMLDNLVGAINDRQKQQPGRSTFFARGQGPGEGPGYTAHDRASALAQYCGWNQRKESAPY